MPTNKEPKKPEGIQLTEKQQMAQTIVSNILGMVKSKWNVVMFKNDTYVWSQYFVGLTLKMPTLVVVKKSDAKWIPVLKDNPLVKAIFSIEDFKEPYSSHIADKIAHYIKQHPEK